MSDSKSWWAKRLGNQPQAREQQYPTPQQGYPPAVPQQQQQQPGYPQQQGYQQQQPQDPYAGKKPANVGEAVEAMKYWTGGEAVATETQRCPSCGGNHYFSRRAGSSRLPPPAPQCFDCGYNGMFEQGDQSAWAATGS